MSFHLHTDIGHDPDDVIALAYLIENGYVPTSISICPGHSEQVHIVHGIFVDYGLPMPKIYVSKKDMGEKKYVYGPHSKLTNCRTISGLYTHSLEDSYITCDRALVIGPALNLGKRLETPLMVFQGGYSPRSVAPLEKFVGRTHVMSYNPMGAPKDFESLRDSNEIGARLYVGKNVCHGYLKDNVGTWFPRPKVIREFYENLSPSKAMHDLLAAKLFIDDSKGIWEHGEPYFNERKMMSTRNTDKEIKVLIGLT